MRLSGRVLVLGVLTLFTCAALAAYLLGRDDDEAWSTVTDAASGIGVSHPSAWPVQTFEHYCHIGPGILVSNVADHTFRHETIPNGCSGGWDLTGLPDDYVLVHVSVWPYPAEADEYRTEPLELDRFERTEDQVTYAHLARGGDEYSVRIRTGTNVSGDDWDVLARVIRSLRFTGVESG